VRFAEEMAKAGMIKVTNDILRQVDREAFKEELQASEEMPTITDEDMAEDAVDMEEGEDTEPLLSSGEIMRLGLGGEEQINIRKNAEKVVRTKKSWSSGMETMEEKLSKSVIKLMPEEILVVSNERKHAEAIGRIWDALPGWPLDLTVPDPEDGEHWDFSRQCKRDKAEKMIRDKRALLLIGSSTASCKNLLRKNEAKDTWEFAQNVEENRTHLRFCAKLYKMQMEQGMYFLHESDKNDVNENDQTIKNLTADPRITTIVGEMNQVRAHKNVRLKNSRKMFMTNAIVIARRVAKRVYGAVRHVKLHTGSSKGSALYDDEFCADVLRGLHDQMIWDGRISKTGAGCVCAFEGGDAKE